MAHDVGREGISSTILVKEISSTVYSESLTWERMYWIQWQKLTSASLFGDDQLIFPQCCAYISE